MPISRTIREQVTGQVRDEVLSGALAAGAVLREAELAERFGVSRGPIRDAFLQLSNEGFLAYEPNRGVTVRSPPDQADRDFIAALRQQVEVYVVTKGAGKLTDEQLEPVRVSLDALRSACDTGNHSSVMRLDLEFHEAMLSVCGGDSLIPAWKQLCARMALAYGRLGSLNDVYAEHEKIFLPLEAGDTDALVAAIKENIT